MADTIFDGQGEVYRRVEVLTGLPRWRDWSDDDKACAVEESCVPGAVVSEIARRWRIAPQQLFTWRRRSRAAALVETASGLSFVPLVQETAAEAMAVEHRGKAAAIEVKLGDAVVRVEAGVDAGLLTTVLRAVRASAA